MIGINQLIVRESNEGEIVTYAEQGIRAGRTLLSLINDILDFSKLEAGKMELVTGEYETAQMIEDITIMTQFRAEEKGLEFIVDINEDLPDTLIGDETRVKQIITNIVTNGVKYTEKGFVRLSASYEDGNLNIIVADSGIGIKKEDMNKLFASFERIENKITHKTEGTGLGMSIVTSLLKMMNGKIGVDSEPGKGTTFTVNIPQPVGTLRIARDQSSVSLAGTGRLADQRADLQDSESAKKRSSAEAPGPSAAQKAPGTDMPSSAATGSASAKTGNNMISQSAGPSAYSGFEGSAVSSGAAGSMVSSEVAGSAVSSVNAGFALSSGNEGFATASETKSSAPSSGTGYTGKTAGLPVSSDKSRRFQAPDARIIIVDDTRTNLFVATSLIKRTKIITDTAVSGNEFLIKASKTKYDLIFMDYRMPGMDGLEAIEKLRSIDNPNTDTPIVMMTAEADPAAKESFEAVGTAGILLKPLDPVVYETMLAELLPQDKVTYI